VLFVDDINLPAKETYGTQPALELLRMIMDRSGFYDP
jgi:dynein heavy chain